MDSLPSSQTQVWAIKHLCLVTLILTRSYCAFSFPRVDYRRSLYPSKATRVLACFRLSTSYPFKNSPVYLALELLPLLELYL